MILYNGMQGLGDNIYQRAFLSRLQETVKLITPWPQLYVDMPHILPVASLTTLRTQRKNLESAKAAYVVQDRGEIPLKIFYTGEGIIRGMENCFGFAPAPLTLPEYPHNKLTNKPYVLIRPNTLRREWLNIARAPKTEYINETVRLCREAGLLTISVADVDGVEEFYHDEPPEVDVEFTGGELSVTEMLHLTQNAVGVVGGIGWLLPAALAYRIPALIICGGNGGYNHPSLLTDPRLGEHHVTFAMPDNFCMCKNNRDTYCDKTISNFSRLANSWVSALEF